MLRTCSAIILGLSVLAAAVPAAGGQSAALAGPVPYDLAVVVVADRETPAHVALSYSRLINHDQLRAAIERLGTEAGSLPKRLIVSDGPLQRGSKAGGTAAEFLVVGLIKPGGGPLPVAAIVRLLPDWRHMRLVFVLDERLPFLGPESYAAGGFQVRLIKTSHEATEVRPTVHVYEYDVVRMNGQVAPTVKPSKAAGESPAGPGEPSPRAMIGVVAALAVVVMAGAWLVFAGTRRRASRPRGTGSQEQPPEAGSPAEAERSSVASDVEDNGSNSNGT